jgi:hypothetical protein
MPTYREVVSPSRGSAKERGAPFSANHNDARNSELQTLPTGTRLSHLFPLEPSPRFVRPVCRGEVGEYDEDEEREPVCYGDSQRRAEKAQSRMINEEIVDHNVEWRSDA